MAARVWSSETTWKGVLAICSALFACVAVASTAFACTVIMGALQLSPTSGSVRTMVMTSASGLKAGASYRLLFSNTTRTAAGKDCMSSSKVLTSSVGTDSRGSWTNVSVVIPTKSPRGVSQICGMENLPVKNQTGTTHDTFTVT